jgi:hypothetical protein
MPADSFETLDALLKKTMNDTFSTYFVRGPENNTEAVYTKDGISYKVKVKNRNYFTTNTDLKYSSKDTVSKYAVVKITVEAAEGNAVKTGFFVKKTLKGALPKAVLVSHLTLAAGKMVEESLHKEPTEITDESYLYEYVLARD